MLNYMQLTTSSGTSGGTQSNAMPLFPVKLEPLIALPPNGLGTLADVSGTLMFRTKGKEPWHAHHQFLHSTSLNSEQVSKYTTHNDCKTITTGYY
jgi:hypothetical protein